MNREGGIVRGTGKVDVQMVVLVMGWQMTKDPFRQCCDGDRSYRVERPADRRSRLKFEKSSRRRDGYSFISILVGVSSSIKYDRVGVDDNIEGKEAVVVPSSTCKEDVWSECFSC